MEKGERVGGGGVIGMEIKEEAELIGRLPVERKWVGGRGNQLIRRF